MPAAVAGGMATGSGSRVTRYAKSTAASVTPVRPGKTHALSALDAAMERYAVHLVLYYPAAPGLDRDLLKELMGPDPYIWFPFYVQSFGLVGLRYIFFQPVFRKSYPLHFAEPKRITLSQYLTDLQDQQKMFEMVHIPPGLRFQGIPHWIVLWAIDARVIFKKLFASTFKTEDNQRQFNIDSVFYRPDLGTVEICAEH
uniref:Uncharacterized protein n=1 Tax=Leersia perrieri TaxID=77586 RepID=A0A0D9VYW5_9ORYZ